MRYKVLFEKGKYALIVRGIDLEEYAVVYRLDKLNGTWGHTCSYCNFGEYSNLSQEKALMYALDSYLCKTEENYISRFRLEELATKFKDRLIEDDYETAMEYFDGECEMERYEKEFFGIRINSGIEEE